MKTSIRSVAIITLAIIGLAFLEPAHAVVPPPDGGYPGGNTAEGQNALLNLTTGQNNTAVGLNALSSTMTGLNNTAIGSAALRFNTDGHDNTANGVAALRNNRTGSNNVAYGVGALQNNVTGSLNTAIGVTSLFTNTFGNYNIGVGNGALYFNTRGSGNTAVGLDALSENTTGSSNIAIGAGALRFNTTGTDNTAIGVVAGFSQTTGSNNVYIGHVPSIPGENNACYVASIFGQTSSGGVPVVINSSSKLGTVTSSKRFKEKIERMDKTSEALFALNPVTFRYKKEIDSQGVPQFGLVAEDVEKVNPDLVIRDKDGQPYTVRYEAVNAMLLNEFLKEHRKVAEQEATITQLKSELQATAARQQKQIEALTVGLQKVSVQLEMSKPKGEVANSR